LDGEFDVDVVSGVFSVAPSRHQNPGCDAITVANNCEWHDLFLGVTFFGLLGVRFWPSLAAGVDCGQDALYLTAFEALSLNENNLCLSGYPVSRDLVGEGWGRLHRCYGKFVDSQQSIFRSAIQLL
jgi:hypothetical protein